MLQFIARLVPVKLKGRTKAEKQQKSTVSILVLYYDAKKSILGSRETENIHISLLF